MRSMFVCETLRAAFVHIPKTGGTAIKDALFAPHGYRRVGEKHGPAAQLGSDCDGYFVFTMVRNPYRRLASHYRFRKLRDTKGGLFEERFPTMVSFFESNVIAVRGRRGKFPMSQTSFLNDRVTVFKFEDFDASVRSICAGIGIAPVTIPRRESGNYLGEYDWRADYTREAVDMVNAQCAEDFRRFGYPLLTWQDIHG